VKAEETLGTHIRILRGRDSAVARRAREAYDEFTGGGLPGAAAPSASGPTRMDKSKPSSSRARMGVSKLGSFGGGSVSKRNKPKYGMSSDESLAANKKLPTMQGFFNKKSQYTKNKEYNEKSTIGKLFGKIGTGRGGKFTNIIKKVTGGK